ncbi:Fic family protein [Megasphaera sp. AM44-1BH]|uniref:Fic family protein n=1 Tax=Megasphaera sp. AM44-1BH TaxID=2292358 RepID=UPI000E4F0170|nr:Fic family protein [Megasphaera sp. AM44-1BH]RHA08744.1 Fic family protein [Megasphaera sp. AM44-1BH]
MGEYKPPFHMTDKIMNLVADVSEQIGRIKVLSHGNVNPHLRKENRIRTIHSSLAIEHNSLSLEQVTAVINGKHILGNPNEIREVKNAYDTYEMMLVLNPYSVKDLLKAHKMMMKDLIPENGKFRSGGVGVFDGDVVVHMAPPASLVPGEIQDLFAWYKKSEIHPLVRSAIFHYEFEFIHPFADGNGRMGRMWHSLLLGRWNEIFYWLPVEELIRSRQQEYYNALNKSDRESDSSTFVEFMLEIFLGTLRETTVVGDATDPAGKSGNPYVQKLLDVLGDEVLSATEIMERLGLSHRPTFRKNYLVPALEQGIIEMTIPEKPKSRNQRYRKK